MKFAEKLNAIGYAKVERQGLHYFVHPDYTDEIAQFVYDPNTPVKYKVQTEEAFFNWLASVPDGAVIPNPFI